MINRATSPWAVALTLGLVACSGNAPDKQAAASPPDQVAGDHAEAVLVDAARDDGSGVSCSGTLVAPRVVLTAAHCVVGLSSVRVNAPYAATSIITAKASAAYDWDGKMDGAHHDLALVVLTKAIHIASYPVLASSWEGASVVHLGRVGNGIESSTDLYATEPLSTAGGASRGHPLDVVVKARGSVTGDAGGALTMAGAQTSTILGVVSGVGVTSGLEYGALVTDAKVHAWVNSVIANVAAGRAPFASAAPQDANGGVQTQDVHFTNTGAAPSDMGAKPEDVKPGGGKQGGGSGGAPAADAGAPKACEYMVVDSCIWSNIAGDQYACVTGAVHWVTCQHKTPGCGESHPSRDCGSAQRREDCVVKASATTCIDRSAPSPDDDDDDDHHG